MQDASPSEIAQRAQAWQAMEGLHEVTDGGAYGFLALDPKDSRVTYANGVATLVNAGAHTYQLWKRYQSVGSTRTKDRKITRPILSGFGLRVAGVTESSFTLDVETGIIVIPSDPVASSITWQGPFYVPVHFEEDDIDWDLVVAGQIGARYVTTPNVTLTEVLE